MSRRSSAESGDWISGLSGRGCESCPSARPIRGGGGSSPSGSPESPSPTTCVKLSQTGANGSNVTIDHAPTLDETSGRLAILSSAGSRARTGASPGNEQASAAPDPGSSSTGQTGSQMSLLEAAPAGSSSRTSLGSSPLPTDETSGSFSQRWPGSGTAYAGGFSTLDSSEFPSGAVECSLSAILEPMADPRYALSARAARGILRRASVRGKRLPAELEQALKAMAG